MPFYLINGVTLTYCVSSLGGPWKKQKKIRKRFIHQHNTARSYCTIKRELGFNLGCNQVLAIVKKQQKIKEKNLFPCDIVLAPLPHLALSGTPMASTELSSVPVFLKTTRPEHYALTFIENTSEVIRLSVDLGSVLHFGSQRRRLHERGDLIIAQHSYSDS